jgi:hypothetical protein
VRPWLTQPRFLCLAPAHHGVAFSSGQSCARSCAVDGVVKHANRR